MFDIASSPSAALSSPPKKLNFDRALVFGLYSKSQVKISHTPQKEKFKP